MRGSQIVQAVVGVLAAVALLYLGRSLWIPLSVGALLALLVAPVEQFARRRGLPEWLGIAAATGVILASGAALLLLVGGRISAFVDRWPQIQQDVFQRLHTLQDQVPALEALGPPEVTADSSSLLSLGLQSGAVAGLGGVLSATAQLMASGFLVLVFVVLFLAERRRLLDFVKRSAPEDRRRDVTAVLDEIGEVAQGYLVGRLLLTGALFVLYAAGFWLTGLESALVVGLLVALLAIIPYFGNLIGAALALGIASIGSDAAVQLTGVLVTMGIGQLLENYVLTPVVVGEEVSLNPLSTILGVFAFTLLWGPVGAIVAIPLLAVVRVVLDRIPAMASVAFLLGTDPPPDDQVSAR